MITNILAAGLGITALLAIWNWWRLNQLNQRMSTALGGSNGKSLESKLNSHFELIEDVNQKLALLDATSAELTAITALASQKISVVRFNPFGDTGGDQSFCLAVLDSHDSGYILSSIHGRSGTRVYIKPIDFGKSKYQLSKEEKQAYEQASRRVPK